MNKTHKQLIYVWRAILIFASIALLGWLFWINLVPSGILVLQYKKGSPASPITDLHPEKRVIDLPEYPPSLKLRGAGGVQRFYIDPVYFDAKVPREFEDVTVDITWQNQSQPILELGARKVRESWGFVLKPLQNKIIDGLDWPCQRYSGVIFCQRQEQYANLAAFFSRPPAEKALVYNYAVPPNVNYDLMNVNTNAGDYNYLIATYEPPESLGDNWHRKSIKYNWRDFALYINEISFLVSAPELNKGHGEIVLGDITITLKRDPLDWQGFAEYVKNQVRRLK